MQFVAWGKPAAVVPVEYQRVKMTLYKGQEQPEQPWAPKDTDMMLKEIANAGYGVSGDCSSAIARRLIKAYNSKADIYEQVVQKQGQPLREGFSVVKVRAARA